MLEHGGRLRQAAHDYGIPLPEWLDLSTGITPDPWPAPPPSPAAWRRLPEENDGLETAAAAYYGNATLLPVAGSQAAIRTLPKLFPPAAVACLGPLYNEHPEAWQGAGHRLRHFPYADLERALTAATPVVLLCNPNNPTAETHPRETLLEAADRLSQRGAWLVIDEAFMDPTPDASLAPLAGTAAAPRLIVLRSMGKFFGLAGARLGFVFAAPEWLARLAEQLGPWTVSGPAREAGRLALADTPWQNAARPRLSAAAERLSSLLEAFGPVKTTPLFAVLTTPQAAGLHTLLAQQGVLTRRFDTPSMLRFGLPGPEAEWQRLAGALG